MPSTPKNKTQASPLQNLLNKEDVLLMLYSKNKKGYFHDDISQEDERIIYDLVNQKEEYKPSLLIFLDSGGGNVYAAVKIINILRSKYKNITVAVAEEAKSSASLICLAADDIIMSAVSEIGPLDKPMVHPDDETRRISALDIVRSFDGIINTAIDKQRVLASKLLKGFRITQTRALEVSGDFIAKLVSPTLCKEDAKIYNQARRLLSVAEFYGKRFLNKFMLKYIKDENVRERIAELVMDKLIWLYPDHIFAIDREEADGLFLIVKKAEEFDYWSELWKKFEGTIGDKSKKVIKFL